MITHTHTIILPKVCDCEAFAITLCTKYVYQYTSILYSYINKQNRHLN